MSEAGLDPVIEFERPEMYPKQQEAIFSPFRFALIEASTKAGKTSGCIIWLVQMALEAEKPNWNYWWVAPVSDQALIAYRRMKASLAPGTFTTNVSLKTITLANGSVLWFKSGDKPDSLYGEDVYAAVIDEASRTKEESWIALRTTLTATRAPARIIGNVRGRKNWFYQMARRAERDQMLDKPNRQMSYHRIVAADAVDAGVLDAQEIEEARGQMPEKWFRELYYAEASDDGGNPFGLQHIAACVKPLSTKKPRVWGWDLGKNRDYTVGIALDEDGAVCRFERMIGVPWGDVTNTIVHQTMSTPALVDSTGLGDPIVEDIQRRLFGSVNPEHTLRGYLFTAQSKQKLMEGLAVAIQHRTVWFPEGVIRQELEQFEFELRPGGVRYSAPAGFHDDCVCALALARMCFNVVPQGVVVTNAILDRIRAMPKRRHH